MALTTAALKVALLSSLVGGVLAGGWEGEGRPASASASTTTSNSHALATAMSASSTSRRSVVGGTWCARACITVGATLV
jgi:hypothetical protein